MAVPEEKLPGLLAYCRIDGPDKTERALLDLLYDSAVSYLENAGVARPEAGTPRAAQYELAVSALVLDAYDLREPTITGTIVNDNPAFRRLILQLQLTEPASEPGAGSGERSGAYGRHRQ